MIQTRLIDATVCDDSIKRLHNYSTLIDNNKKAKILMVHGNAQSGRVFAGKTRFLQNILREIFPVFPAPGFHPNFPGGVELFYPTAPHLIRPITMIGKLIYMYDDFEKERETKFDAWTWGMGNPEVDEIQGYAESVRWMLSYMKDKGPFDGIVGFSVGASMAYSLVAMSEGDVKEKLLKALGITQEMLPPPFLFAILCSGFIMQNELYESLYMAKVQTPTLHTYGIHDAIIKQEYTLALVDRCENAKVLWHHGAHFVPKTKLHQIAMHKFICDAVDPLIEEGLDIDEELRQLEADVEYTLKKAETTVDEYRAGLITPEELQSRKVAMQEYIEILDGVERYFVSCDDAKC